jgi:excisionase family DNA binding protein
LTCAEAAELLRCKRQRIDDLLSAGRLSRFKEGGRTLVSRAEVEALVSAERVAQVLPIALSERMATRRAA